MPARLEGCVHASSLPFDIFGLLILQKMSVSDCLLSSLCSIQERGQQLWWGRWKISAFFGSLWHLWPSFTTLILSFYSFCLFTKIHLGPIGQMLSEQSVVQLGFLVFLYDALAERTWCVIHYISFPSHLRDVPQAQSPLSGFSGLPNERSYWPGSLCTLISQPFWNCLPTVKEWNAAEHLGSLVVLSSLLLSHSHVLIVLSSCLIDY